MQIRATGDVAAAGRIGVTPHLARRILLVATAPALAASVVVVAHGNATGADPDLVRVLRFMAAMKAGFALIAWAACFWRLARPAASWRTAVYVSGPPVMIAGTAGMWSLHHLGASALGLHLGLLAVLAAALTDPDFISSRKLWSRRLR